MEIKRVRNENLKTIKKNYSGNLIKNRQFLNEYELEANKFYPVKIIKEKFLPKKIIEKKLLVQKYVSKKGKTADNITWLGHSSILLSIDNKKIIFDPNLDSNTINRRKINGPCKANELGDIDYVCISHNHPDHLNYKTIKKIPSIKNALLPLGLKKYFDKKTKLKSQEAGWFQEFRIEENFKIFFLPAIHWSNRTFVDFNKTLWGSYLIKTKNKTIFFAGDTAYGNHFKEIKKLFGPIDICIIPVGCYEPERVMKKSHVGPHHAVKMFDELEGTTMIPIHFGTYKLSLETTTETTTLLKNVFNKTRDLNYENILINYKLKNKKEKKQIRKNNLKILKIGKTYLLNEINK